MSSPQWPMAALLPVNRPQSADAKWFADWITRALAMPEPWNEFLIMADWLESERGDGDRAHQVRQTVEEFRKAKSELPRMPLANAEAVLAENRTHREHLAIDFCMLNNVPPPPAIIGQLGSTIVKLVQDNFPDLYDFPFRYTGILGPHSQPTADHVCDRHPHMVTIHRLELQEIARAQTGWTHERVRAFNTMDAQWSHETTNVREALHAIRGRAFAEIAAPGYFAALCRDCHLVYWTMTADAEAQRSHDIENDYRRRVVAALVGAVK